MGERKLKRSRSLDQVGRHAPYMIKTLKILLLRKQKANDLETWYAASGAWVLPNLFK